MSSEIQTDFDRIALVSPEGAAQNDHYLNFLLRHLPLNCDRVLEIGCGTGTFARVLAARAQHVLAIDLSPEMIRLARERSTGISNLEFHLGDILDMALAAESFDCIASIATLHHLPYREMLLKMKPALKPGGVLLVLDLFERINWHGRPWHGRPARDSSGARHGHLARDSSGALHGHLARDSAHDSNRQTRSIREGLVDTFLNLLAIPVSVTLRLIHQHRLVPSREVRAAWAAHEAHDLYPTIKEVRTLCAELLPGAKVRKHLLWRYSIVWVKRVEESESVPPA